MFIFKPGNIDPVTMPRYNYFIIPGVDVYLIIWLMDVSAVLRLARCPACILMSGRSPPGCSGGAAADGAAQVGLWLPELHFTGIQSQVWLKPNGLPFIFCFPSVNTDQGRQISHLNTISLRLRANKDASPFAVEADDQ